MTPAAFPASSPARWAAIAAILVLTAGLAGAAAVPSPPLTPNEKRQIVQGLERVGEAPAQADDASVERAVIAYARRELGLRFRPRTIDPLWGLEPPSREPAVEFEQARAAGTVASWIAGLPRTDQRFVTLAKAAAGYRKAAAAPFSPLIVPTTLRFGSDHADVAALRDRLASEGAGIAPTLAPTVFDEGLKTALVAFQERQGLVADGVPGPRTIAALNVTPTERLAQVEANLERLRWLPRDLPADRLEVNVAAAEAVLYRQQRPVLTMRIVVGDLRHKTPIFASRIETVVFNPPWNVPASIARQEILPKAARDPGYLARHHYTLIAGRLQQRPGSDNALGRIKFDLPSPYGVYLHDTPGKAAFQQPVRALSHGCMRLEKPQELALQLLETQGWTAASLASAIDAGLTQHVALQRPLPLFVIYQTVIPDGAGGVRFVPDTYGWDAKLTAALSGARPPGAQVRPITDCAEQPGGSVTP